MSTAVIALRRMPHVDLNNVVDVLRRRSPDKKLMSALKRGGEAAFVELVDRHHGSLVRIAQTYVRDHSIAEEVAGGLSDLIDRRCVCAGGVEISQRTGAVSVPDRESAANARAISRASRR